VLWSLVEHYWMTRDKAWLARITPSMKKAADWIVDQRKLTKILAGGVPCPSTACCPPDTWKTTATGATGSR